MMRMMIVSEGAKDDHVDDEDLPKRRRGTFVSHSIATDDLVWVEERRQEDMRDSHEEEMKRTKWNQSLASRSSSAEFNRERRGIVIWGFSVASNIRGSMRRSTSSCQSFSHDDQSPHLNCPSIIFFWFRGFHQMFLMMTMVMIISSPLYVCLFFTSTKNTLILLLSLGFQDCIYSESRLVFRIPVLSSILKVLHPLFFLSSHFWQ